MHCLPLILLSLLGGEQVIDDFRYADADSARQAWTASENTAPVSVAVDADRPVLRIDAPFGSQTKMVRAVADRKGQLDLASPSGFALDISATAAESIGYVSLYFHSGDGWYSAGKPIGKDGWRRLHFPKTSFQKEGVPTGWNQIDKLRIVVWRANGKAVADATVSLRRLAATWHDVAVIVPDKMSPPAKGEGRANRDPIGTMVDMLDALGLGADTIEESTLTTETLTGRRVAILPHNPALSDDAIAALVRYAENGGRLIVCYTLRPQLATVLDLSNPKYVRQDRPGQFAEMRFDAEGIVGLPKSVRQNSWNITAVEPKGEDTRILARWYDDAGNLTDYPAVLLSSRGAFVSHILLPDDRETKSHFLAALLGHLSPPLWETMALAALDAVGRVGHCEHVEEIADYVNAFPVENAATKYLDSAEASWKMAQASLSAHAYDEATEQAQEAHDAFVQAYLRVPESPKVEGRAAWNHSGTGAYPGDWERSAKLLAENGFNMVMPNMLWGGLAHFPSEVLPQSEVFRKYGDQIEQCCNAAEKYGLEVHVWKVNFNLSNAPKDWTEKLRQAGRMQVTAGGKSQDWLCPSNPENQKLEAESLLEVARKYPVAGLHLDYIRYPGRETCYCDGCRRRFESQSGRKVVDWPNECYSGARKEEYNAWRCRQITALVETISREARKIRPGLKISAAVFGAYPGCRESVAQDWPEWVRAGYLDFVCPMDYTENDAEFASLVTHQLRWVDAKVPIYPGIGATASGVSLTADRVLGQIHLARTLGAGGFSIFNFDHGTAESIVPFVGLGAGSAPAAPPHRIP